MTYGIGWICSTVSLTFPAASCSASARTGSISHADITIHDQTSVTQGGTCDGVATAPATFAGHAASLTLALALCVVGVVAPRATRNKGG